MGIEVPRPVLVGLLAALAGGLVGMAQPQESADTLVLRDGGVRLTVSHGARQPPRPDRLTGGAAALRFEPVRAIDDVWGLEIRHRGKPARLRPRDAHRTEGGAGRITWELSPDGRRAACGGDQCLGVTIDWEDRRGRDLASSITVRNRNPDVVIVAVDYPYYTVAADGPLDCALPHSKGRLLRDPLHDPAYDAEFKNGTANWRATYPGRGIMQFVSCHAGGAGFVLREEDAEGHEKEYRVIGLRGPGRVTLTVRRIPRDLDLPGRSFEMPYRTVLAPVAGDWFDAARQYRQWAQGQPWSRAALAERERTAAFRDAPATFVVHTPGRAPGPSAVPERMRAFQRAVGWPEGAAAPLFWYSWQAFEPGSRARTVYCGGRVAKRMAEACDEQSLPSAASTMGSDLKPRTGVAEAVRALDALGVRVLPYLNTRIFDQGLCPEGDCSDPRARRLWQDARRHTVKGEGGEPRLFSDSHPVWEMERADPWWRARYVELARALVRGLGAHGLYMDSLGGLSHRNAEPPSGVDHGGGRYQYQAMHGLAEMVQDALGPDAVLVDENGPEVLIDVVDGTLTHENVLPDTVPLRQAVYHDRWASTGRTLNDKQAATPLLFELLAASQFVDGQQIGRLEVAVGEPWRLGSDDPGVREPRAYLGRLLQSRWRDRRWLARGEMLRPPVVEGVPTVAVDDPADEEPPLRRPAVLASAWRGADGAVAIVATNWTDREASGRLSFRAEEAVPGARRLRTRRIDESSARGETQNAGSPLAFRLPPRSVAVWEVTSGS